MDALQVTFEAGPSGTPSSCRYLREPALAQARLAGREVLKPNVALREYQVRAVADYIVLEIELSRPTQLQHVRRALEPAFGSVRVTPIDPGAGAVATIFYVRLQDPARGRAATCTSILASTFGLAGLAEVNELEISVDFYPRSGSEDDRRRMVGVLQRHFIPEIIIKRVDSEKRSERALNGRGHALKSMLNMRQNVSGKTRFAGGSLPIVLDGTVYVMDQGASRAWRIQDKVQDRRQGATAHSLPEKERRARIEVTFARSALREIGVQALADALAFRFETLVNDHFSFWLPTLPQPIGGVHPKNPQHQPALREFLKWGVLGSLIHDYSINNVERRMAAIIGRSPRPVGANGTLMAWSAMHDKIRGALRALKL